MEDRSIVELLLQGLGAQQIANRLIVTEQEVQDRLSEILRDLGFHSLVELRFLALSLPGDTAEEKSSHILEMLKRRA